MTRPDPALTAISAQADAIAASSWTLHEQYRAMRAVYVRQDRVWLAMLGNLERQIMAHEQEARDARQVVRAAQSADRGAA